jgi:hypothetical protein
VAISCSSKAMNDVFLSNDSYAKIGGVTAKELSILEFDFLEMIGWHVNISPDEFQLYYRKMLKIVIIVLM